ncbi:hypothetical protein [Pantoea sp. Nvir]
MDEMNAIDPNKVDDINWPEMPSSLHSQPAAHIGCK